MIQTSTAKSYSSAHGLGSNFLALVLNVILNEPLYFDLARLASVWAFIRQSDGEPVDFNPQYRSVYLLAVVAQCLT